MFGINISYSFIPEKTFQNVPDSQSDPSYLFKNILGNKNQYNFAKNKHHQF